MRIAATPIALAVFCLGVTIVPAAAAEHDDLRTAPMNQVALQPAAASSDGAEAVAPNCLLPGHLHSFGGLVMVTPRRAVTLAATDCAARGGDLIASTAAAD